MITVKRYARKPFFQELVMFFPVFSNYKVSVILAESPIIAGRYVADRDYQIEPPKNMGETDAFTKTSDSGYAVIHLRPNTKLGTIAHEAYHAVRGMMSFIGAHEENEIVAYHLGYIVDKIVEFNLKVAPRFEKRKKLEERKCQAVAKSADKSCPPSPSQPEKRSSI